MILNQRPIRIQSAVALGVVTYLAIRITINPSLLSSASNLIEQIAIAGVLGSFAYLILVGFYRFWHFYTHRWIRKIGPLELFKMCNDLNEQLLGELSDIFGSIQHSDGTSQSLFIGRLGECFAFVYGLVLIEMCKVDPKFMQSERFEKLNSRLLQRLIDLSKEKYTAMDIDMNLLESQLRKTKLKELEKICESVENYQSQSQVGKNKPPVMLINHFSRCVSMHDQTKIQQLTRTAVRILENADQLILSYQR